MNRTLKKVISILIVAVMMFGSVQLEGLVDFGLPNISLFDIKAEATTYSGTCGTNLTWSLDTDTGVLNITGTGVMKNWSNKSTAPWYSGRSYISSVNIGDGVTSIGSCAFYDCENLKSINVGNSVIIIGDYAFDGCANLTSITIPDNVTTIGDGAFSSCKGLTSIIVGNGVTTIGNYAFEYCYGLTNITIPDNVNIIGDYAFFSCKNLASITIPNSVTTIGDWLFCGCNALTSVTIPDSVTIIGDYAFRNCVSLANITIPDSVISIGDYAFCDCDSLINITIPNSVTIIGDYAFCDCNSLVSITIPDSVVSIGDYVVGTCDSLTSVYYCGTISQWNNVSIGYPNDVLAQKIVFKDSQDLSLLYWGSCGSNLRWKIYSNGEITISGTGVMDNWTSVSNAPWYNYRSSIKSITVSEGVTSIGDYAFYYWYDNLTNITISESVKSIGEYAFSGCSNLDAVYYTGDIKSWCTIDFKDSTSNPMGIANKAYINDVLLNGSLVIPDGVTSIGDYVFYGCDNLTSVTIGNGVTNIGDSAFQHCYSLTNVIIPESVTHIGDSAFYWCDKLTNVTIPDSVTTVGAEAFHYCSSLTSVTIGNSVTTIGAWAFYSCDSLTSISIPNSVTSIGKYAFYSCGSLKSVIIGNSVITIGDYAFYDCYRLTSITIPDSVTTIGDWAFYDCGNIHDVYYTGTEEEWLKIVIGHHNDDLTNVTIHYNHIHKYIETVVTPVGCLNNGEGYGTCVCGLKTDSYIISTTGHNIIIDKAVEPTCTETGLTEGQHCSRCDGVTVKQEVIPALNHEDTLVQVEAKAPTCTEIGWNAYEYCTACKYTTYIEKANLGHDIVIDKAVESTCTEIGLTKGQHCSRCDNATVVQETIPLKPHNHTVKYDSEKHWKECVCGSKIEMQNHTFDGNSLCECGYKRVVNATVIIKNNTGSRTINYGETLKLSAIATDKPADATITWYIDGAKKGEGETFNVSFKNGTKTVEVKLVDANGNVLKNASGNEIKDSENVTVKGGFFQKIISFFKNLFGINRTVVQAIFKGTF